MNLPEAYTQIQRDSGLPLAWMNPGSNEVALPRRAAIDTLTAIKGLRISVLGGDVLMQQNDSLEYVYANWYCSKGDGESPNEYADRSLQYALSYISSFQPAFEFEPLFVLVLQVGCES